MFSTSASRRGGIFFRLHMSDSRCHFSRTLAAVHTGERVLHDDRAHLGEANFDLLRGFPYLDPRRAIRTVYSRPVSMTSFESLYTLFSYSHWLSNVRFVM